MIQLPMVSVTAVQVLLDAVGRIDYADKATESDREHVRDILRAALNKGDGPYSAELAEAFRIGARELCNSSLGDKIEVEDGAPVRECEGDGVMVQCWLYVHDTERSELPGEEEEAPATPACGHCGGDLAFGGGICPHCNGFNEGATS